MSVNLAILKSTTLIDKNYVQDFKLSPDGQYVIYRGDTNLFSALIDGGTSVDLGATSYEYAVTPDSTFVVYVGPALPTARSPLHCGTTLPDTAIPASAFASRG